MFNAMDWISMILLVIGGINWGLVGFFNWNLVDAIFCQDSAVSRIIYAIVGIAALWVIIFTLPKF